MKGDEERNEAYARCEAARGVWFEGREGRRTSVALAKGDALRMGILVSSLALATGCDMAIDNSIASLWNSFWQGPKVGCVLFGAILLVSLFAIRTFKVYRARVSNGNKFKKVSDTLDKENGEVDKKVEYGLTIGRKKPYNIRKIFCREGFSSGQNKRGI